MTNRNYLDSIGRQVVSPQGALALLGWLGAAKRRRRSNSAGWIVGGVVAAAGAALLFGTSRGQSLRSRIGSSVGGKLGELFGGVAGAHPVRTAQLADKVKHTFAAGNG